MTKFPFLWNNVNPLQKGEKHEEMRKDMIGLSSRPVVAEGATYKLVKYRPIESTWRKKNLFSEGSTVQHVFFRRTA